MEISIIIIIVGFLFFATIGYDNFKGITIELDEMYTNTNEMACAVLEKLKSKKRTCEIIEMGKGYPKLLIDGKKYVMTYKMASVCGCPVQVVQLKICKD